MSNEHKAKYYTHRNDASLFRNSPSSVSDGLVSVTGASVSAWTPVSGPEAGISVGDVPPGYGVGAGALEAEREVVPLYVESSVKSTGASVPGYRRMRGRHSSGTGRGSDHGEFLLTRGISSRFPDAIELVQSNN